MANPLEIVKAHPIATGVVVVVVIGAVLLFSGGGDSVSYAESGSAPGDELSAGLAMQQLQASLSAKSMEIAAQKEVAINENATQLTLAQLAKDVAIQQGAWAYNVEESRLASEERVTTSTNTLTAALKQKELENERAASDAQFATIKAQSDAILDMSKINAQTQLNIVKEQNKPRGLFSFLFG